MYTKNGNVNLYYEIHGQGAPIIFIHGAGGSSINWWQQVPFFAQQFKVITYDMRGFGRSQCSKDDYLPELFADDLKAVANAAGVEKGAIVVAHSEGGFAALPAALKYNDLIGLLILSDSSGGLYEQSLYTQIIEDGAKRRSAMNGITGDITNVVFAMDYFSNNPSGAFLLSQMMNLNPPLSPDLQGRFFDPKYFTNITAEVAKNISIPIKFIFGSNDIIYPNGILKNFSTLLPNAACYEIQNAGHMAFWEHPDEFNHIVKNYISAIYNPDWWLLNSNQ